MYVVLEMRCDYNKIQNSFMLLGFDEHLVMENQGFTERIWVAWKKEHLTINLCKKDTQYIHLQIQTQAGNSWFFITIYVSPDEVNISVLWEDLKSLANNVHDTWMLVGNFNDIISITEKKGGVIASSRKCNLFKARAYEYKLMDLGSFIPKFTWRAPIYHRGQRIYEKLDQALSNVAWREMFHDTEVKVLAIVEFSCHHPILFMSVMRVIYKAPRPFKFESSWLVYDTYHDILKRSWRNDISIVENMKKAK